MKKITKIYINAEHGNTMNFSDGPTAFFVANNNEKQQDIIYAGKFVLPMPISDRAEISLFSDEYDVCFIFDDNIPNLQFYPVPQLFIFAIDSFGGCFASTNIEMNIEKTAPIYYIEKNFKAHYLSPSLKKFLELVVFNPLWKKELNLPGKINLNISKQRQEYLISKLNLQNSDTILDLNKPTTSIKIYSSFDEAKKEIQFFN